MWKVSCARARVCGGRGHTELKNKGKLWFLTRPTRVTPDLSSLISHTGLFRKQVLGPVPLRILGTSVAAGEPARVSTSFDHL